MNLCFIEIEELEDYLKVIENEIGLIKDLQVQNKMREFQEYFITTWINGTYNPSDWNQLFDLLHRSNNWAESFHSSFGKKIQFKSP